VAQPRHPPSRCPALVSTGSVPAGTWRRDLGHEATRTRAPQAEFVPQVHDRQPNLRTITTDPKQPDHDPSGDLLADMLTQYSENDSLTSEAIVDFSTST
jgi:hypothetical protein